MSEITRYCDSCDTLLWGRVLSVGASPPPCRMRSFGTIPISESHVPLTLAECEKCSLVQLVNRLPPQAVFPDGYTYSSGNSPALKRHFSALAAKLADSTGLIVDIGANDGTLLDQFPNSKRIGVEPTGQIERLEAKGIEGVKAFFSTTVAEDIVAKHGHAAVVTACNVLAHVTDIHDVMQGIRVLLGDDGLLIAENGDVESIGRHAHWDTVYHEHLRYYSPYSFHRLCAEHGLGLGHVETIPTHGGSFRAWVKPGDGWAPAQPKYEWGWVRERAGHARAVLRSMLAACWTRKEAVVGIGATARASTIIGYCGLTAEDITCVAEVPTSDKLGHYMAGTEIPVLEEEEVFCSQPEWALLFSWHMADEIIPKLRKKGLKSKIIVPLPTPRVC